MLTHVIWSVLIKSRCVNGGRTQGMILETEFFWILKCAFNGGKVKATDCLLSAKFITLKAESIQICDCNVRVSVLIIFRTAGFM